MVGSMKFDEVQGNFVIHWAEHPSVHYRGSSLVVCSRPLHAVVFTVSTFLSLSFSLLGHPVAENGCCLQRCQRNAIKLARVERGEMQEEEARERQSYLTDFSGKKRERLRRR